MHRRFTRYSIVFFFALLLSFQLSGASGMPKSAATADAKTISGTVIETMNSSGYTYMLVGTGTVQTWVAIPETTVKKGSQVSYYEGTVMPNFTSKTLNRTFANIVFSEGLTKTADSDSGSSSQAAQAASPKDSFSAALQAEQKNPAAAAPSAQETGGSAVAIAPLQEISIAKASGENAYSVAEVFTKA